MDVLRYYRQRNRGIKLFVIGYALNLLRSLLPLWILGNVDEWASVQAFFVVGIMQFAGLSFMFIALLRGSSGFQTAGHLQFRLLMVALDQFIMLPDNIPWSNELLTHCTDKKKLYGILLPVSLCGVMYVYYRFYSLYPDYTGYYWGNNFYDMGLKNVLLTLGVMALVTLVCVGVTKLWLRLINKRKQKI